MQDTACMRNRKSLNCSCSCPNWAYLGAAEGNPLGGGSAAALEPSVKQTFHASTSHSAWGLESNFVSRLPCMQSLQGVLSDDRVPCTCGSGGSLVLLLREDHLAMRHTAPHAPFYIVDLKGLHCAANLCGRETARALCRWALIRTPTGPYLAPACHFAHKNRCALQACMNYVLS